MMYVLNNRSFDALPQERRPLLPQEQRLLHDLIRSAFGLPNDFLVSDSRPYCWGPFMLVLISLHLSTARGCGEGSTARGGFAIQYQWYHGK